MRAGSLTVTTTLFMACWPCLQACAADKFDIKSHYSKTEHMAPMRDGVRLFTIIYSPKDTDRDYPVMLFRTPYSIRPYGPGNYRSSLGPSLHFSRGGYHFVYQDVRGKFRSEGKFEVMKPLYSTLTSTKSKSPASGTGKPSQASTVKEVAGEKLPEPTDESTDTFDTIEWLLNTIPNNNRRVGQWGISYPGWQTVMGMVNRHPALKASSPQASPADMFVGDDWHHNGAFRLMYTFHWLAFNAAARSGPRESRGKPVFDYGTPDGYQFFPRSGSDSELSTRVTSRTGYLPGTNICKGARTTSIGVNETH